MKVREKARKNSVSAAALQIYSNKIKLSNFVFSASSSTASSSLFIYSNRTSMDEILRAKSFLHSGKKQQLKVPHVRKLDARPLGPPDINQEVVMAYTGTDQKVYGAKATINFWQPSVQTTNEYSQSLIRIIGGSFFDESDLNFIEAGWQVNPGISGDNKTRLYNYWSSGSATGCYNTLCRGFVQTNNLIAVGVAMGPVSSYAGSQYEDTLSMWKDPKSGNWWMGLGDKSVGYWPKELFTSLADHGTTVEWVGQVLNTKPNGKHTATQMGSGHFAGEGFGKASYFRNVEIINSDNSFISPQSVSRKQDNGNCYDIQISNSADWGTHFYYGGPGNNPNCP